MNGTTSLRIAISTALISLLYASFILTGCTHKDQSPAGETITVLETPFPEAADGKNIKIPAKGVQGIIAVYDNLSVRLADKNGRVIQPCSSNKKNPGDSVAKVIASNPECNTMDVRTPGTCAPTVTATQLLAQAKAASCFDGRCLGLDNTYDCYYNNPANKSNPTLFGKYKLLNGTAVCKSNPNGIVGNCLTKCQ